MSERTIQASVVQATSLHAQPHTQACTNKNANMHAASSRMLTLARGNREILARLMDDREPALPVMSAGQHTHPLSFSEVWFPFISFPFHTHLPEDTGHSASLETGQFL